jgi:hypothetical protein
MQIPEKISITLPPDILRLLRNAVADVRLAAVFAAADVGGDVL